MLLRRQRRELVGANSFGSYSVGLQQDILLGRELARAASYQRLLAELEVQGVDIRLAAPANTDVLDAMRARRAARSYTDLLERTVAKGATTEQAIIVTEHKTLQIAATETAHAFNDEREQLITNAETSQALVKVWDATLDKHTCSICRQAHGATVPRREQFVWGVPGKVHPKCRCIELILTESQARLAA
jgi:hypothetical protein